MDRKGLGEGRGWMPARCEFKWTFVTVEERGDLVFLVWFWSDCLACLAIMVVDSRRTMGKMLAVRSLNAQEGNGEDKHGIGVAWAIHWVSNSMVQRVWAPWQSKRWRLEGSL